MSISVLENEKIFHLRNSGFSYIMGVNEFGYVECLHYGTPFDISASKLMKNPRAIRGHSVSLPGVSDRGADASQMLMEYGCFGSGDYREPSVVIMQSNGSRATDFRYEGYRLLSGRDGGCLPRGRGGDTLEISLVDEPSGLRLRQYYTVYDDVGVIIRSCTIENGSDNACVIDRAYSFNLDLCNDEFDIISLCGAQLRERNIVRSKLVQGVHKIDSKRGVSSAQKNPFVCLCSNNAEENSGVVYGATLLYSGSYVLNVELDECDHIRINGGINDFDFSWKLEPGECFETPDCILSYSSNGFNGMSQSFHDFFRYYLMPPQHVFQPRPIVINNWEATYFDFDEQKLKRFVDDVKNTGIDLLVLDDGWFGNRNNDQSSLGDWFVNKEKLPNGLRVISDYCQSNGMKFGLWFEPEMISENSELFRDHPDWCIHIPGRVPCVGRDQLVLDLTRTDVREYIKEVLSKHIEDIGLTYIKWDMNRCITEHYSGSLPPERGKEFSHGYVLGLYEILSYLNRKYPELIIESCASGGCRFDGGMLAYSSQIWTSDNTDALSRAKIQYGSSYVYPLSVMSCHVSACPNAQTGRVSGLHDRYNIASLGAFGYELDPGEISEEEIRLIRQFNDAYRADEDLVLQGDLYRLANPQKENLFAQLLVSKDKRKAKLVIMIPSNEPNGVLKRIRLYGLSEELTYEIYEIGESISGAVLVKRGLDLPMLFGDYKTIVYHFAGI